MKNNPLSWLAFFACVHLAVAAPQPIETGTIQWQRNLTGALEASRQSGKPLFMLFQEIPGCAGCQKFGREVLSDPLLKEAVETEFIPLLVYNNRQGADAETLQQFKEPPWNFQVVRFIDASGKDLIPRKDRVWTLPGIAERMQETLQAIDRPVPEYLRSLSYSSSSRALDSLTFSMACFWTGEMKLGSLEGVVFTEAGFFDRREVTRVWFDPAVLSKEQLVAKAAKMECANKVYFSSLQDVKRVPTGKLEAGHWDLSAYRKAPESDQKKQLQGTPWAALPLTEYQKTKVNAFARSDASRVSNFLSPSQRTAVNP